MEEISELLTNSLWGGEDIDFSFSPYVGAAGGLLTLWKRNSISVILSFHDNGFLGIKVSWRNDLYYIVNIYSSCSMPLKRILWRDLLDLKKNFNDGEWLLGGDFNVVKNKNERVGSVANNSATGWKEFSDFIESVDNNFGYLKTN